MTRSRAVLIPAVLLLTVYCAADSAGSETTPANRWSQAVELHTVGFAALENETPAEAEEAYLKLTGVMPDDPLPWANLAVARLRQQKTAEALAAIDEATKRVPESDDGSILGHVLGIRGAILDWEGRAEEALEAYGKASREAPDQPELLYTLYRQAIALGQNEVAGEAMKLLVDLRPENFVVLVEEGKRAVQQDDRAGASKVYLRLRELLWQAPPIAETALQGVLDALETGEPPSQAGRVPAARLENVLKVTPMYRESLRELSTGIQAVPMRRFATAPPRTDFGDPLAVTFAAERLSEVPTRGRALALADFDDDGTIDLARIVDGEEPAVEIRLSGAAEGDATPRLPVGPAATGLEAFDLYNDGGLDLLAYGAGGGAGASAFWNGTLQEGKPAFAAVGAEESGLAGAAGAAATVLDFDIEGDLDLVLAGAAGKPAAQLFRNNLQGPLEAVGDRVFPALAALKSSGGSGEAPPVRDVVAVDVDVDGDIDLVLAGSFGLVWLDNLRQGLFADRTAETGLGDALAAQAVVAADLDNDGKPELITAGAGLAVWSNRLGDEDGAGAGGFVRLATEGLPRSGAYRDVVALDVDNDGRLDLAGAGPSGVAVFGQAKAASGTLAFRPLPIEGAPSTAGAIDGADLDGDGDLDLVVAGAEGLHRLINEGGNKNGWLAVRLKGLQQGNGKNNVHGIGGTVEVFAGSAYQYREHDGRVSHFGLGKLKETDAVRVVWTNGVPQNRIHVAGEQTIVEEQVLKGSCPFLYTYTGADTGPDGAGEAGGGIEFVTDLLWNAPVGLPVAPGVYLPSDPDELVEVAGAKSLPGRPGVYDLRITEELWEAAYFDHVRLWVVDHPADTEVASNLKIVPGEAPPAEDVILAAREVRPVVAATDGRGRDVTDRVRERDHVYADGYVRSAFQGVAAEPWSLTFDLGPEAVQGEGGNGGAQGAPVRLLLDGWIFPTDASLNLALAQRSGVAAQPPRLEVETAEGWRVLMPNMGHPAGKTKTMVVDTPPLPQGARRLRIVTGQWISWDRIAWSRAPADGTPRVAGRLAPVEAELRYRGFSAPLRRAPNGPHEFDYTEVSTRSPWEPIPGPYTRYGDVRELLLAPDDRSVVLGAGDEMALLFDASELPPPPAGWERTLFLESHGWDKDFDKNTYAVDRGSLPLPFRRMGVYGPGMEEGAPDLGEYRERWLTREWPGPPDGR